eukprot:1141944-Prorocentrum_minimum.AAC.1
MPARASDTIVTPPEMPARASDTMVTLRRNHSHGSNGRDKIITSHSLLKRPPPPGGRKRRFRWGSGGGLEGIYRSSLDA